MSIIQTTVDSKGKVEAKLMNLNYDPNTKKVIGEISYYNPKNDEKDMRDLIIKHFSLGDVTMQTPRIEFNDMSVLMRDQIDQLSMNVYQPNNGNAALLDVSESWKSRAIRPIVRNKAMSIAAHATARLIFPKIFAYDQQSEEQEDAAQVMGDLMEWAAQQSGYEYYALNRVLQALWSPASIGYTEYAEVYRNVKTEKGSDGKWIEKPMLDEDMSGFRDEVVPVDQLYIENFFEPDVQKQAWLILRKVISFDLAQLKYQSYPNFKYVKPGVQILYNDANQSWYQVYDNNMRQTEVEEITYWNKSLDVKLILVNGVLLSEPDCPNPRIDKKYPFDKFGYSLINSRCFYYKSLAFLLQSDASIVNTLYPMIIDGTYLSIMRPMVNTGSEIIKGNVIVPGAVTTLSSPDADLRPINTGIDLRDGMATLQKVEDSLSESSQANEQAGQPGGGSPTAYAISLQEKNAQMVLGLFVKMISEHVRQYGKLRMGDIIQFLTIPEVSKIEDDAPLVYKTFLLPDKNSSGGAKSRNISFDSTLPDEMTEEEYMNMSYGLLKNENKKKGMELYKVNPELFRNLKYMCVCSPDVMNPMSDELETAYSLELYDRAIANPIIDQEAVTKDFLLGAYKKSKKNPEKYLKQQNTNPMAQLDPNAQPLNQNAQGQQPAQGGNSQVSPSVSAINSMPSPIASAPVAR